MKTFDYMKETCKIAIQMILNDSIFILLALGNSGQKLNNQIPWVRFVLSFLSGMWKGDSPGYLLCRWYGVYWRLILNLALKTLDK